jgi:TRAP-type C4-dicarboxylate transport system permease small subunit
MAQFHRITLMISNLGMAVSVVIMVAMVCLVLAEVVARNVFGTSTFIMNELVGYGVAAMTVIALGNALENGALIRMNLLLIALKPDGLARRALELISISLAMIAVVIALRYFLRSVTRSFDRGYTSETAAQIPLWIPEAFMVAGLTILLLQLLSYLIRLFAGAPLIVDQGDELPPATYKG